MRNYEAVEKGVSSIYDNEESYGAIIKRCGNTQKAILPFLCN